MASKHPVGNLNPTSSSTSLKTASDRAGKKGRRPHRRGLEIPIIPITPKETTPDVTTGGTTSATSGAAGAKTSATTTAASGSRKR
jgi:hypothetical protein